MENGSDRAEGWPDDRGRIFSASTISSDDGSKNTGSDGCRSALARLEIEAEIHQGELTQMRPKENCGLDMYNDIRRSWENLRSFRS